MKVNKIEDAIEAFKNGSFIVVMDDEDRENEGDLIIPAQHVTPDNLAFMIRYTSGVLTVPMTSQRLQELELPLMVHKNTEPHRTAFTISVDYLQTHNNWYICFRSSRHYSSSSQSKLQANRFWASWTYIPPSIPRRRCIEKSWSY